MSAPVRPEDCPDPSIHGNPFRYCPYCTWMEDPPTLGEPPETAVDWVLAYVRQENVTVEEAIDELVEWLSGKAHERMDGRGPVS